MLSGKEISKWDARWLSRALALARRGGSAVSPNPLVGCVLVKNNRIIAEGFHERFGGPHAEAAALRKAGDDSRGATAYVNLEPCCHAGKTPPCADALIASGIKELVVAMKDPNPVVAGKGLRRLRDAGIRVRLRDGNLARQALALNAPFATWVLKKRPYVILKAAVTLDGKMATASGNSKWITSYGARRCAHRLRARADAVLVGTETVLRDNPSLTSHGTGPNPLRVILDARLRIPASAKVFDANAPTLIATSQKSFDSGRLPLKNHIEAVCVASSQNGRLDLKDLMARLAQRGVARLLAEGGAKLHTSLLSAGLVDEINLFIGPKLIGGDGAPTFFEGRGVGTLRQAYLPGAMHAKQLGPDIFIQCLPESFKV
ncbi:MAG: bifunctional diaminohydroxyphosphoribosylaminopyrimidine deaminase/5-amino-6-(5-phosphoribosylamino)uracil reductase RibD [Elusimicrobia bacterium]|nr:bifunctional diaminohydroxyphosphoribosylaminopyrimidine deaminase/5-amino-6-(5-phosphoribosylamino)uracil reductase RibD [Elusimicrobiota bacterium]